MPPTKMQVIKLDKSVPTEQEINQVEIRLKEMRAQREEAKKQIVAALRSDHILSTLGRDELIALMRKIQNKIQGNHRKVRGSPVSEELKASLISALKEETYTLSQLERMFNLSVSYISRVKKQLREEGQVMNAYEDHQLQHQHAG